MEFLKVATKYRIMPVYFEKRGDLRDLFTHFSVIIHRR